MPSTSSIDYSPFLHVLENGQLWWRLEDAIKLGAGYLPIRDDEQNLNPVLRAKNNQIRANERTLLSEFNQDHYTEANLQLLVRDDGRYVEAREFLNWLTQHISLTQSPIPFPNDLIRAVRRAAIPPVVRMPASFESLTVALDVWFDKPQDELPDEQRYRVETDFFPMPWNDLSPDQRRSVAAQWDYQHDPVMESDWQNWWDFYQRMQALEDQIEQWNFIATPTATDLAQKENRLAELQRELANIKKEEKHPYRNSAGRSLHKIDLQTNDVAYSHIKKIEAEDFDAPNVKPSDAEQVEVKLDGSIDQGSSGNPYAIFFSMIKLTADEVSIAFVGDKSESGIGANNILEITARGEIKRVALAAIDLVDRRRGSLNSQGVILLGMTQKKKLIRTDKNTKKISRLRQVFHQHLGISADPFHPYCQGAGWEPRFKICDKRGAADERAKRDAELRTVSYEQMLESGERVSDLNSTHQSFGSENDDTDEWLKANDPDVSA